MHGHEESTVGGPRRAAGARLAAPARHRPRGLFYDGSLDAASYLRWLRDDRRLLRRPAERPAGLAVRGRGGAAAPGRPRPAGGVGRPVVAAVRGVGRRRRARGGTLVSSDRSRLVVDVPAPGRVEVALWWSRWSSVEGPGGCVRPGRRDGWTTLVADRPGRYVLTSSWQPHGAVRLTGAAPPGLGSGSARWYLGRPVRRRGALLLCARTHCQNHSLLQTPRLTRGEHQVPDQADPHQREGASAQRRGALRPEDGRPARPHGRRGRGRRRRGRPPSRSPPSSSTRPPARASSTRTRPPTASRVWPSRSPSL